MASSTVSTAELPELRPMTVIEIFDAAFRLYRNNFALFLGIMSVALVPMILLSTGIVTALYHLIPQMTKSASVGGLWNLAALGGGAWGAFQEAAPVSISSASVQDTPPITVDQIFFLYCGQFTYVILVHGFGLVLATGALTRAVSDRYLLRKTGIVIAYKAVFRIFFPYMLTALLVGLMVGLGFGFCCVPGLVLYALFAFVSQIMVLEGNPGFAAMTRSIELSALHRWRVVGMFLITYVIDLIIGGAIGFSTEILLAELLQSPMEKFMVQQSATHAIALFLKPLWAVALILLYYDVRIRKEAFDLQILAQRLA